MSNLEPERGAIAVCSAGSLGLITVDEPQQVTYSDGTSADAWVGIHLTDELRTIGDGWSSRDPKVIGHIDNLRATLEGEGVSNILSTNRSESEYSYS
jgi:hypothetical protein